MSRRTGILNLPEINIAFKRFMSAVENDQEKVMRKAGFMLFSRLQVNTPKDTVRAAGGWNVRVDAPPSEWKPPKGLNFYPLRTFPSNRVKHNSFMWICNNVEYIIPLEDGHSMQAPSGFANQSFTETRIQMEAIVRRLDKRHYGI